MHQEQDTHEPDVHLHPSGPDVDSQQRDAGLFTFKFLYNSPRTKNRSPLPRTFTAHPYSGT